MARAVGSLLLGRRQQGAGVPARAPGRRSPAGRHPGARDEALEIQPERSGQLTQGDRPPSGPGPDPAVQQHARTTDPVPQETKTAESHVAGGPQSPLGHQPAPDVGLDHHGGPSGTPSATSRRAARSRRAPRCWSAGRRRRTRSSRGRPPSRRHLADPCSPDRRGPPGRQPGGATPTSPGRPRRVDRASAAPPGAGCPRRRAAPPPAWCRPRRSPTVSPDTAPPRAVSRPPPVGHPGGPLQVDRRSIRAHQQSAARARPARSRRRRPAGNRRCTRTRWPSGSRMSTHSSPSTTRSTVSLSCRANASTVPGWTSPRTTVRSGVSSSVQTRCPGELSRKASRPSLTRSGSSRRPARCSVSAAGHRPSHRRIPVAGLGQQRSGPAVRGRGAERPAAGDMNSTTRAVRGPTAKPWCQVSRPK